jgi:hypothetical protein
MSLETIFAIASVAVPFAALFGLLWLDRHSPPQRLSPEEEDYRWQAIR